MASNLVQQWNQAGVEATRDSAPMWGGDNQNGLYDVFLGWQVESWGGHPDLSWYLDSWHSEFLAPIGSPQPARNWARWNGGPELDAIIEEIRTISFDDPRGVELGQEFVKLGIRELPTIPIMALNLFATQSNKFWTGWPTAEDNYTNPVTNWANARYIWHRIQPVNP